MKTNNSSKLMFLVIILVSAFVQAKNSAVTIKGRVNNVLQKSVAYSTVAIIAN